MAIMISCAPSAATYRGNNKPVDSVVVNSGDSKPAESPSPQGKRSEEQVVHRGKYTNRGFGFSLTIPDGYEGIGSPPETPQHGIVILVSREGEAKLYIDASYNALSLSSLDEMYKNQIKFINDDAKSIRVGEKKSTHLSGHPAIEFTVKYVDKKTDESRITRQVVTTGMCPGEGAEIIYTINLDTPEPRFPDDERVMEQVLESWRMLDNCD
jgi:hypothetical protein